ncbi:MAG: alpha/beta hydrolase, partial [Planctomycetia bacterium]|nr:alpha/beta hydrolase [Planctomycetia bacterium]
CLGSGTFSAGPLLEEINRRPGETVLVGWSLGGMLAIEAATAKPDSLRGLVLVSTPASFTAPVPSGAGSFGTTVRAMRAKIRRRPRVVLRQFFNLWGDEADEREEPGGSGFRLRDALTIDPAHLAAGLAYLAEKDFREQLGGISAPALVVHGSDDRVVPVETGRHLAGQMPHAEFHTIAGCGHGVPEAAPETLAELVKNFLNDHGL